MENRPIGFVGQGVVGKAIADETESRGYKVVRYSLEPEHLANHSQLADCDIIFVAVPTPGTPRDAHDLSHLRNALSSLPDDKIVVIKSTTLPGTTDLLQAEFPALRLISMPEFLNADTAREDAATPIMSIFGRSSVSTEADCAEVVSIVPFSAGIMFVTAREAELIKYMHNLHGVFRIMLTNILFDVSQQMGCNWSAIYEAMRRDPYMNSGAWMRYNKPIVGGGRGAGGHCFVKDLSAFADFYARSCSGNGLELLTAMESYNADLLCETGKDMQIVASVYGDPEFVWEEGCKLH